MLQYLIILLSEDSVAYCHAERLHAKTLRREGLMPLETLQQAIRFGMQENLMIQFVYPAYDLPKEYIEVIDSIDHVNIRPLQGGEVCNFSQNSEVKNSNSVASLGDHPTQEIFVTEGVQDFNDFTISGNHELKNITLVLRLPIREAIKNAQKIAGLIGKVERLNICYTDLITKDLAEEYKAALMVWNEAILKQEVEFASGARQGCRTSLNILTDRLQLKEMHNCEAGVSNITVAPNGRFYICPAFYYDESAEVDNKLYHAAPQYTRSVGDLTSGVDISNQQLLQLKYAPVCRICDAFHCHRCVWQNEKMTFDRNTPSHEQCLQAHLERNASRELLNTLKQNGIIFDNEIKEIDYLDPFVIANNWK